MRNRVFGAFGLQNVTLWGAQTGLCNINIIQYHIQPTPTPTTTNSTSRTLLCVYSFITTEESHPPWKLKIVIDILKLVDRQGWSKWKHYIRCRLRCWRWLGKFKKPTLSRDEDSSSRHPVRRSSLSPPYVFQHACRDRWGSTETTRFGTTKLFTPVVRLNRQKREEDRIMLANAFCSSLSANPPQSHFVRYSTPNCLTANDFYVCLLFLNLSHRCAIR